MKDHKISGGGGIQLHLVETGNPAGRPILFIHGFSQCWRAWNRQMNSDLAEDYRLVAMDMRGHGLSEGPPEGFSDSKLWADACFTQEPSPEDLNLMLEYNMSVPPYVRQALFSRAFDNDDLLPRINKPVLVTHGDKDAIVSPAVVDRHKAGIHHAQIHMMANAGHAPFWDDATTFNNRLRAFAESV